MSVILKQKGDLVIKRMFAIEQPNGLPGQLFTSIIDLRKSYPQTSYYEGYRIFALEESTTIDVEHFHKTFQSAEIELDKLIGKVHSDMASIGMHVPKLKGLSMSRSFANQMIESANSPSDQTEIHNQESQGDEDMPRYTVPTTEDQLAALFQAKVDKNSELFSDLHGLLLSVEEAEGCSKLLKDITKLGYFENYILDKESLSDTSIHKDSNLLGFNTIDDITFFGLLAGQDYTEPVFLILYKDDKAQLRAYIPTKGNSLNPNSKEMFGEDEELDQEFASLKGFKTIEEMIQSKKFKTYFYNEDLIKEQILKRLQLR